MSAISASVGRHSNGRVQCHNLPADQATVIGLLNKIPQSQGGTREKPITESPRWGIASDELYRAIVTFQSANRLAVDGHIDPGQAALRKLDELASRAGPPLGVPSADLPEAIRRNPDYVERRVYGVGILFLGGPFRLDLDPNAARSLAMDRSRFDLSPDPFAGNADLALTGIYATEAQAFAAVKSSGFQRPGYVVYTHYRGAENIIFPTIMSATTTPALIWALQLAVNDERDYARAASKTLLQAFFTLAGLRYAPAVGGAAALASANEGITVVEIGAGDLRASIELAKRGGAKLIAVDPVVPSPAAIRELEGLGGQFVEAVEKIPASSADRVFQYFPWRITGTGRAFQGGTWRLVQDTMRILKPGGAARFVTEEQATAEFLANEASKQGMRTTLAESTAGAAAPGASGAGVPSFGSGLKVWVVELFK